MPTPLLIGVVSGCTVAGLAVVKLDTYVRARLALRREHEPLHLWPTHEPHSNVGALHHLRREEASDPFDWKKDDDWSTRLFKRL